MTLRMAIRIACGGDAFCDTLEIDKRNEIEQEMIRRGLGVPWGGITLNRETTIDFEFYGHDIASIREQIASVFEEIAPRLSYSVEPGH